ncbi:MAG: DUF523 domain-containing protein [Planctomycetes bacterium]|nr:DUF523 domain-containing protein [Planctomycetota bacterium]
MRLAHHHELVARLRRPGPDDPWRVLCSGCLFGWPCGVDGTSNGEYPGAMRFLAHPAVRAVPFCPEDHALGTPRNTPDLHGGDGFAVLRGTARARDQHGTDITEAMLAGARAMLAHARAHAVDWALLMDMSGACGSQVISEGCRFDAERRYQRGVGVATAMLLEAGIPVVSQRDFHCHELLWQRLEPDHRVDASAVDHHETAWYRAAFGGS